VLSNKFAEFFIDKVDKIRSSIKSSLLSSSCKSGCSGGVSSCDCSSSKNVKYHNILYHFKELSESDVQSIIMKCANKTCTLDGLPTWLLKSNINAVLPPITCIVNSSLRTGVFPDDLKQAIVTPILKKTNLDWNNLHNYRPVSNIGFIGKVIEKAAMLQVNEHMHVNDLDELYQSAYKQKHSTETALLKVANDIAIALDENKAAFLVMLDLSAAFDTIDHDILFHRLEHGFGIKGTALQWFTSYISGRQFRVSIGGVFSQYYDLKCGVPQGSIIGPRAFTKYAQNVASIIRRYDLHFHIYADDVQIYTFCNPKVPGDAACAIFKLSMCIKELREWLMINMLKLNDSKTEFFIAASSYNMPRLDGVTITIGDVDISASTTIKNLGVTFDVAMNLSDHVTAMCKSINFHLWNLSRIRRFITEEACANAMRALVISKLDYANALLSCCRNKDIARLQRLQNRAARIIFQVPRRQSASPLLDSLHWLNIDKRIKFKILLYIYKALNGLSPVYLSDSISIHTPSREGLRSSQDHNRLVIPRCYRRNGDRSFSAFGSKLWNHLPLSIRSLPSVQAFKRSLKTHMY
jgi:hypothetical protein